MQKNNNKTGVSNPAARRQQRSKDAVRSLRHELTEQSRNPQAGERREQARALGQMARRTYVGQRPARPPAAGRGQVHPHMRAYVDQISNPRGVSGVPPLYTDNLVQSVTATQVKVTRFANVTVPANSTRQMVLFSSGPTNQGQVNTMTFDGNVTTDGAPGDSVASHTRPIYARTSANVEYYGHIGPITTPITVNLTGGIGSTDCDPLLGLLSEGTGSAAIPLGRYVTNVGGQGTAGSYRWGALTPLTKPPYKGTSTIHGHARWTNTGMEVDILCTTAQGSRAGNVITVTPPHEVHLGTAEANQEDLARFKTYAVHAIDREIRVIVPPRPFDNVYEHPRLNPGAQTAQTTAAGFIKLAATSDIGRASCFVFFNNPSSVEQTYSYEVIANYSIAGDLVAPLANPVPISLETKPAMVSGGVNVASKPTTTPGAVQAAYSKASSLIQKGLETGVAAVAKYGSKALEHGVFSMPG